MKVRVFKWAGWILVSVGIGYSLHRALRSEFFIVKQVHLKLETEGLDISLFEGLKSQLNPLVSVYKGQMIWALSLSKILETVEQNKMVESVRIQREIPGELRITVFPHKPQLILLKGKGQLIPVGRDGSLLPKLPSTMFLDLPVLRGKIFWKSSAKRKAALDIVNAISVSGQFNQSMISEIQYHKIRGFNLILNDSGALVKFGNGKAELKASLISRVMKYLEEENIQPRIIDARYSNKVIVKRQSKTTKSL